MSKIANKFVYTGNQAAQLLRTIFSDGIPMIHRNGGERGEPLTLPVGGNGRLYGLTAVGEYCPRGNVIICHC